MFILNTALQLYTVHKLRNILSKINNKTENRKKIMNHACKMFKSETKAEAFVRYKKFIQNWSVKEPRVVKTMRNDIEYYFTYFNFAVDQRNSLKSNNPLERINRELRKVSRRYGYFQSQRSLDIFMYLTIKEAGHIINKDFEDMPEQKQNLPFLEFANKS